MSFTWVDVATTTSNTIDFFGFEIQSPLHWAMDKFKKSLSDLFIDYLTVSPIVIGVSAAVYLLLGMFSKTLAKIGVIGVVLYSGFVFLFM